MGGDIEAHVQQQEQSDQTRIEQLGTEPSIVRFSNILDVFVPSVSQPPIITSSIIQSKRGMVESNSVDQTIVTTTAPLSIQLPGPPATSQSLLRRPDMNQVVDTMILRRRLTDKQSEFRSLVRTLRENINSVAGSGATTKRALERLFNRIQDSEKMKSDIDSTYPDFIKNLPPTEIVLEVDQMTETSSRMRRDIDSLRTLLETKEDEVTTVTSSGRSNRTLIERTRLPTFKGDHVDFPEFEKQFKELTKSEDYPDAIYLAKLKEAIIPKEGKDILTGINSVDMAWE